MKPLDVVRFEWNNEIHEGRIMGYTITKYNTLWSMAVKDGDRELIYRDIPEENIIEIVKVSNEYI